jgi:hypothetical protein
MSKSQKYVAAIKIMRGINPDLASILDYTKRQRLYLALQKRGYTWDTYSLQWQKRGGQAR